jgi:hypothetical protein
MNMKILRSATAALAFTSTLSGAQTPPPQGTPPPVSVVSILNLDTRRASLVEAILENALQRAMSAREQIGIGTDETSRVVMQTAMKVIHEDADRQLGAVLTPEEVAKLKNAMVIPKRWPESVMSRLRPA